MEETKKNSIPLPDDYRVSDETVTITVPRWFEKVSKVYTVEKTFRFTFTDNGATAAAICKFVADRGAVDIRHKEYSITKVVEMPDGKKRSITEPRYGEAQLKALPDKIYSKVEDHAPRVGAQVKKPLTAAQILGNLGKMDPSELAKLLEAVKSINVQEGE